VEPLTRRYDAALFDLDGVLYLEGHGVPHAPEGVAAARAAGMRVAYVTNNASRPPSAVAERLTGLGIPAEPDDGRHQRAGCGARAGRARPRRLARARRRTAALADEVRQVGLVPVHALADAETRRSRRWSRGLSPEVSQRDLADAAVALRTGAVWVAANTDLTLPSVRGPLPGNGAFVAVLEMVTGLVPLVAGKPDPALHRESVERVVARTPLVVGDRLDTDVLGAVRGGADSLLVLTGVTDRHALLAAARGSRPTYVSSDLRGLTEPHPEVEVDGIAARCRGAVATWQDGHVVVEGAGDDALRAEAALTWALTDAGRRAPA
jgi:ribonucleotide monophosphatase NagD (HAD superfamily)